MTIRRAFTVDGGAAPQTACVLTLHEPVATRRSWSVKVQVVGAEPDMAFTATVHGADGLQALLLAIRVTRAKLESCAAFREGRLYFIAPDFGLGLDEWGGPAPL
jgi:hypothetical protein